MGDERSGRGQKREGSKSDVHGNKFINNFRVFGFD